MFNSDEEFLDKIKNADGREKVALIINYALFKLEAFDQDKAKTAPEIIKQIKILNNEKQMCQEYTDGTLKFYISTISSEQNSEIYRTEGGRGYYLDSGTKNAAFFKIDSPEEAVEEEDTPQGEAIGKKKRVDREALLYPVLRDWLLVQEYERAKITSDTKGNGKWGNPDIVGLRKYDFLDGNNFEIATIEAKTNSNQWEQWIFEAVSHRRFSNRSYFAFGCPVEGISKIPKQLRNYSELYKIGILVIGLSDEDLYEITFGDGQNSLSCTIEDVVELYSAPYTRSIFQYQIEYLKSIEVVDNKTYYMWGETVKKL